MDRNLSRNIALSGVLIAIAVVLGPGYAVVNAFLRGKQSSVFVYVVQFLISCSGGAVIAYIFLKIPVVKSLLLKNKN